LTVAAHWDAIEAKVQGGQRLTAEEGLWLLAPETDLHAVGRLANLMRRRKNGRRAHYNVNAHLNPTNVCIYRCPICAYSCDAGDARAYLMDDAQVLARGREAVEAGCTELHIVGGIHPQLDFEWYERLIKLLHDACPSLHLKAWTAVEIAWFAERSGLSIEQVLRRLIDAGLGSLPGGGAEVFAPDVRAKVSPGKADAETWLTVHRTAHRLGLRSNASLLFGHIESAADRIDHLDRLRRLQDETGGFQAFIPLSFHPENTKLAHIAKQSGLDELRMIAVARLMLDNFDHIKAYWISLGVATAQVALGYGADDLDGTVRQESIHHDAGATSPDALTVEQLRRLIEEAGCEPVERDTLYRPVIREAAPAGR